VSPLQESLNLHITNLYVYTTSLSHGKGGDEDRRKLFYSKLQEITNMFYKSVF